MRPLNAVALALSLLLLACGHESSPVVPAPVAPNNSTLPAGRYFLGVGKHPDAVCAGPIESWGIFGPNIAAAMVLERDGDGWVARSESASDGDLELRLRPESQAGTDVEVSGQIRGTARHTLDRFLPTPPRTASWGGEWAVVNGRVIAPGHNLVGTVTGQIVFRDSLGVAVTCPVASLLFGVSP
jgi:hypothetical protein